MRCAPHDKTKASILTGIRTRFADGVNEKTMPISMARGSISPESSAAL
jgi:hypothetical protein